MHASPFAQLCAGANIGLVVITSTNVRNSCLFVATTSIRRAVPHDLPCNCSGKRTVLAENKKNCPYRAMAVSLMIRYVYREITSATAIDRGTGETPVKGIPMLRWLSELTEDDCATVGPKIARLGTLRESGIDVPDGFAVTTGAFRAFLARNSLEALIDRELASATDIDNLAEFEAVRTACANSSNVPRWKSAFENAVARRL